MKQRPPPAPRGRVELDEREDAPEIATVPFGPDGDLLRKAPLAAVVRVLDANASPKALVLRVGTCTIGCSRTCDIVVEDTSVSRVHAELGLVAEGVAVRDLGSRNGTFYFGQRVEKVVLSLGTRIRVGRVSVAIDADEDALTSLPPHGASSYGALVGASIGMRRLFAVLARLEGSLATVLVTGESGVGKELVARALHDRSRVASGPFVALNCGALPREVIASELFGHRRGAFTGAVDARRGAFESAHGGTLFLDEIGELPLDLQPSLLRAIELGEIRAVGDDTVKQVRVRLVAATNRDLEAETRSGRFRQDLYYRLAVVRIGVPPLRDRRDDIEPLALAFARSMGLDGLPPAILEALKGHPYPGNVRELRNAVESYQALGMLPAEPPARRDEGSLERELRAYADPRSPYAEQKEALIDRFTAAYLQALLELTGNNQSEAARISGLNRGYVGRLVARFGLGRSASVGGEGSAAARGGDPREGD